jgi:oligoribonuclease
VQLALPNTTPLKPGKLAIIWGDLETTGLNPNADMILEVGFRATDWYGVEIDRITLPILNHGWRSVLTRDPAVWAMHQESGLIEDLNKLQNGVLDHHFHGKSAVAGKLLVWLKQFEGQGPHQGKFPLAGNSVHFDRKFMFQHMPVVDNWFSYRNLDISAIREACKIVNPALHSREPSPTKNHRPQGDLDASIILWQHYIENFFIEGSDDEE